MADTHNGNILSDKHAELVKDLDQLIDVDAGLAEILSAEVDRTTEK
ncbi:hypothetical protein [Streptomyces sp. NPDC097610]